MADDVVEASPSFVNFEDRGVADANVLQAQMPSIALHAASTWLVERSIPTNLLSGR